VVRQQGTILYSYHWARRFQAYPGAPRSND